jgi:class 3 adenylate cyclase
MDRKLAVICTDIAGYSRLIGVDDESTLPAPKAHGNAIDPVIFKHAGRIVKTTGDGLLVENPIVVAAVQSYIGQLTKSITKSGNPPALWLH